VIVAEIDAWGLTEALREFAELTRRDVEAETRRQAGLLIGNLIAVTPPSSGQGGTIREGFVLSVDARRAGEARVGADVSQLFAKTRAAESAVRRWIAKGRKPRDGSRAPTEYVATVEEAKRFHLAQRSRATGRASRTGPRAWAPTGVVKDYTARAKANVGRMASGWVRAANTLGTPSRYVPAWVRRHGATFGWCNVVASPDGGIDITAANATPGIGKLHDVERRVRWALKTREQALYKQMLAIAAKRAARV
jgi:hypothetical protein